MNSDYPAAAQVSQVRPARQRIQEVTRTPYPAILLLLASGFPTLANSETTLSLSGLDSYRSLEGAAHSSLAQGLILSAPALPDPATAILGNHSSQPGGDWHPPTWYLQDAWINNVGLLLFNDADNDGHYAGFSLSVDADSSYSDLAVYLSIDLQRPFNAVEALHTSAVFPLYGHSTADEYQIDIELLRNYPLDHYDLIVELRDAHDHQLLDSVSSDDFSNLRALPLESENNDDHYDPSDEPIEPHYPMVNDDIFVAEYAGSFGILTALSWILVLLARRLHTTGMLGRRSDT